jgi:hypothetical protein
MTFRLLRPRKDGLKEENAGKVRSIDQVTYYESVPSYVMVRKRRESIESTEQMQAVTAPATGFNCHVYSVVLISVFLCAVSARGRREFQIRTPPVYSLGLLSNKGMNLGKIRRQFQRRSISVCVTLCPRAGS